MPLIVGVVTTLALSGTLVIAGLKAGILPGVSPLVILFAWGAFAKRIAGGQGSEFLNTAQVAGSAGVAVTAGVIFTAPVIQILSWQKGLPVPPVDVPNLIYLSISGALIGYGFVGLGAPKFLADPTLPAPEARSCHTIIQAAVTEPEKRPDLWSSLFAGLIASVVSPLFVALGIANAHVVLWQKSQHGRSFAFDLPFAPIYMGIGGLLTLSTAMLVCSGSLLRLAGDFMLAGIEPNHAAAAAFPPISMRWVGGGAMTVAVVYSLYRLFGIRPGAAGLDSVGTPVLLQRRHRILLGAAIAIGFAMIAAWLGYQEGVTWFSVAMMVAIAACCGLMVVLGALLSLQIGSSASPVSGTVFVTVLVLCIMAIATGRDSVNDVMLLVPLTVATCVAICAANDSSQDFKTLQLCELPVERGFLPQFCGLMAGCIAVPTVLFIAHEAYQLGTDELKAPQATLFATVLEALLLSDHQLPWWPMLIGIAVGVAAVVIERIGSRFELRLPSMALAVGIYLPPYLGVGIMIGALARQLAQRKSTPRSEAILAAAGLIAGAALFELIIGSLIVIANTTQWFAFSPEQLRWLDWSESARNVASVIGIASLCAILFVNSRPKRNRL